MYFCDHCREKATYRSDSAAEMDGWTVVKFIGGGEYALCRVDAGRVRAFLRGDAVKADL